MNNSVYIEKSSLLVRFSYSIVNRKSSSLFGLHIVKIRTWMPWWLVNVSGHRLYMMCRLLKSKLKKPLWVHSIHTLHITCYHKLTITTSLLMFTIEKTKSFFLSFFLFIHEEAWDLFMSSAIFVHTWNQPNFTIWKWISFEERLKKTIDLISFWKL